MKKLKKLFEVRGSNRKLEMAPKNPNPTPVTVLPEYATVLTQCVAQRSSDGGAPALVAATDREAIQ